MQKQDSAYVSFVGKLSVFTGKACGAFYLIAIILSVIEVFNRYALNEPSIWSLEIVMALCGTAWLLSAGPVTQQNRHITVTVMELMVGEKIWRTLSKVAIVISIIAVLGLAWSFWEPAMNAFANMERSGSAMNSPAPSYIRVLVPIACVLYVLQLTANLLGSAEPPHQIGTEPEDLKSEVME